MDHGGAMKRAIPLVEEALRDGLQEVLRVSIEPILKRVLEDPERGDLIREKVQPHRF